MTFKHFTLTPVLGIILLLLPVLDTGLDPVRVSVDKRYTVGRNEQVRFSCSKVSSLGDITWQVDDRQIKLDNHCFSTGFAGIGKHRITATWSDGKKRSSDTATVYVGELSGRHWVKRYPSSYSTATLVPGFREKAERFIAALRSAGAGVRITNTYRPKERAYLMHYSYRIAHRGLHPTDVPPSDEVFICWVHRKQDGSVDLKKSRAHARDMASGYRIVYPAALHSPHIRGEGLDMVVSWEGTLKIRDAKGKIVTITSGPRNGDNKDLHKVALTYGVHKFVPDPPHWGPYSFEIFSPRKAQMGRL